MKHHAETWEEYNELSVDGKKAYFDGKVKRTNMMHMYIDTSQNVIHFTISLSIIDVIIKELFYYNDKDEEDHHMNMEWIRKRRRRRSL